MAWAATEAKAKFSEVLDRAETDGPQLVRRRKQEFYILTREQRDALTDRGKKKTSTMPRKGERTLTEFFRSSPLSGSGIDLGRPRTGRRNNESRTNKPFVSAWDALEPSFDERFDIEFPRLKGKLRKADLG